MIYFSIYLPSGKILRTGSCPKQDFLLQQQDGELIIEGASNSDTQWVVDGRIADLPPRPSDSEFYYFDYASSSWVFDTTGATNRALFKRNTLLADGPDRINPLWWASMTPAQQSAWESYRQALLDITNQPGYPMTIDWPNKPE